MVWDLTASQTVPATYTLKLIGGVMIGGIVVDSSDSPIPDVKLSFHRFGGDMDQKGELSELAKRNATTDSHGRWQIKNLPTDLLVNIAVMAEHPDYLATNVMIGRSPATEKALRAGTFKLVLGKRVQVHGIVIDENGSPVEGAKVFAGRPFYPNRQQTNTDSAGRFTFDGVSEGPVMFSALAKSRKPVSRTLQVSAGMEEVRLKLEPGGVVKGIVQDKAGQPLAGVSVSLGNGRLDGQPYEFATTTADDGRFVWDGAPDDPLQFDFSKSGYVERRFVQLKVNEENIVTLRKSFEIQGLVLDADSGQPITNFHATLGQSWNADQFFSNNGGGQDVVNADGQFTLSVHDEQENAVKVSADNYAEQVQSMEQNQDGPANLEFRLKPTASVQGTVVGTDGAPLPGVQVALTKSGVGGPSIMWHSGKLQSGGNGKVVTTDSSGKFNLGAPPENGANVVAVGEQGFASATVEQVRDNGVIVLQPFGRLEGTLKIAGQPSTGSWVLFTLQNLGVSTDFEKYKAETDDQGKFQIERVPAGEGQLVRLIKTSEMSWAHSHSTTVNVEPGKTTVVNLGDSGGLIRGRARVQNPPEDQPLTISGSLSSTMPTPPSFSSAAEFRAFQSTPDWKARIAQAKHFTVIVNGDGSFLVDSVPPGDYTLMLRATPQGSSPFGPPIGPNITRNVAVTVPDNPDPGSPIDIGEVVLREIRRRP
jgi:hypothetical protein